MAKRRITIYDLAEKLGISAATVSRALADDPRVKDSTKEAVLELASKLQYQPNHIASALRKGRSKIIGVIIPTSNSSIFFSVIYGIEEVANRAGYNVLIGQSHESFEKEIASINTFIQARIEGIILSIAKGTRDFQHFENLIKHDIPVVFFDRVTDLLPASTVEINDYEAGVQAVTHLYHQGYRRIAHFCGPTHVRIYQNRLKGYLDGLRKVGLPIYEPYIMHSDLTLEEGRKMTRDLLTSGNPPDAVFSASDDAALGATRVALEMGWKVPEDFGTVGFANKRFTSLVSPPLTSIDQRTEEMGRTAAKILLSEIHTKKATREPQNVMLNGDMVVRRSSCRKKASIS